MDEFDLIDRYFADLLVSNDQIEVAVGDDAAVLMPDSSARLLVTTDTQIEGRHFPVNSPAANVAYRSVCASISDIAAMGGRVRWATLALTLPASDEAWLGEFASGIRRAVTDFQFSLIGGDTTRGPLTITWTILGELGARPALTRAGAKVNDDIFVTGTLGDAAGALEVMVRDATPDAMGARLVERFWNPRPRLELGLALGGLATSCIDISDGLLADLGHITTASGCGAQIDLARLPVSAALLDATDENAARRLAATGGDDYELCFSIPPERGSDLEQRCAESGLEVTKIGRMTADRGLAVIGADGSPITFEDCGYRHF